MDRVFNESIVNSINLALMSYLRQMLPEGSMLKVYMPNIAMNQVIPLGVSLALSNTLVSRLRRAL